MYTVEETLAASNIVTALTVAPYLIYSEVFELARRPLVFLALPMEDFSLIGAVGNTIRYMFATHLTAATDTEANIINPSTGMPSSDKTITSTYVSVTDPIFSATQLSDIMLEDFPNVDWVRQHLRNMGLAILEYLDALVEDVIEAGAGVDYTCSAHITYADITTALARMENGDWIADESNPPFLIVSPESAAQLLNETLFVDSKRYTLYDLGRMIEGEIGMYAGCRVLKSSLLGTAGEGASDEAFIVFPNNTGHGPVIVMAWKRRMTVKNFYWTKFGYTYYVASVRAKPVIVQSKGACHITISTTP